MCDLSEVSKSIEIADKVAMFGKCIEVFFVSDCYLEESTKRALGSAQFYANHGIFFVQSYTCAFW